MGKTALICLLTEYFLNADESATTRYVTQIIYETERDHYSGAVLGAIKSKSVEVFLPGGGRVKMTLVMSEMHLAAFISGSCSAFTKWGRLFSLFLFFFFFATIVMESITLNYVFRHRAV